MVTRLSYDVVKSINPVLGLHVGEQVAGEQEVLGGDLVPPPVPLLHRAQQAGAGHLPVTLLLGPQPGRAQHRGGVVEVVQRRPLGELVEVAVVAEALLGDERVDGLHLVHLRPAHWARTRPQHLLGVKAGLNKEGVSKYDLRSGFSGDMKVSCLRERRDGGLLHTDDARPVRGEGGHALVCGDLLPRVRHPRVPRVRRGCARVPVALHHVAVHAEGDGVHGEGAHHGGADPAHQARRALGGEAGAETVRGAAVLLRGAPAVRLQPRLEDVLRVGEHPGEDARHAARQEDGARALAEIPAKVIKDYKMHPDIRSTHYQTCK